MILTARPGQRGFTLLEVLIVMVILGVSATLVIGSFDSTLRTAEERQWVEKTLREIIRVRSRAVLSGRPQQLSVDFAENRLTLQIDLLNEETLLALPEKLEFKRVRNDAEIALDMLESVDDRQRVTFFPDGTTSGARFELVAPRSGAHRILIHGLTGKVEEQRGKDDTQLADLQLRPLKNGLEASLAQGTQQQPAQQAQQPQQPQPGQPGAPAGAPGAAPSAVPSMGMPR